MRRARLSKLEKYVENVNGRASSAHWIVPVFILCYPLFKQRGPFRRRSANMQGALNGAVRPWEKKGTE